MLCYHNKSSFPHVVDRQEAVVYNTLILGMPPYFIITVITPFQKDSHKKKPDAVAYAGVIRDAAFDNDHYYTCSFAVLIPTSLRHHAAYK